MKKRKNYYNPLVYANGGGLKGVDFLPAIGGVTSLLADYSDDGKVAGSSLGQGIGSTLGGLTAFIPGVGPMIAPIASSLLGSLGNMIGGKFDKPKVPRKTDFFGQVTSGGRTGEFVPRLASGGVMPGVMPVQTEEDETVYNTQTGTVRDVNVDKKHTQMGNEVNTILSQDDYVFPSHASAPEKKRTKKDWEKVLNNIGAGNILDGIPLSPSKKYSTADLSEMINKKFSLPKERRDSGFGSRTEELMEQNKQSQLQALMMVNELDKSQDTQDPMGIFAKGGSPLLNLGETKNIIGTDKYGKDKEKYIRKDAFARYVSLKLAELPQGASMPSETFLEEGFKKEYTKAKQNFKGKPDSEVYLSLKENYQKELVNKYPGEGYENYPEAQYPFNTNQNGEAAWNREKTYPYSHRDDIKMDYTQAGLSSKAIDVTFLRQGSFDPENLSQRMSKATGKNIDSENRTNKYSKEYIQKTSKIAINKLNKHESPTTDEMDALLANDKYDSKDMEDFQQRDREIWLKELSEKSELEYTKTDLERIGYGHKEQTEKAYYFQKPNKNLNTPSPLDEAYGISEEDKKRRREEVVYDKVQNKEPLSPNEEDYLNTLKDKNLKQDYDEQQRGRIKQTINTKTRLTEREKEYIRKNMKNEDFNEDQAEFLNKELKTNIFKPKKANPNARNYVEKQQAEKAANNQQPVNTPITDNQISPIVKDNIETVQQPAQVSIEQPKVEAPIIQNNNTQTPVGQSKRSLELEAKLDKGEVLTNEEYYEYVDDDTVDGGKFIDYSNKYYTLKDKHVKDKIVSNGTLNDDDKDYVEYYANKGVFTPEEIKKVSGNPVVNNTQTTDPVVNSNQTAPPVNNQQQVPQPVETQTTGLELKPPVTEQPLPPALDNGQPKNTVVNPKISDGTRTEYVTAIPPDGKGNRTFPNGLPYDPDYVPYKEVEPGLRLDGGLNVLSLNPSTGKQDRVIADLPPTTESETQRISQNIQDNAVSDNTTATLNGDITNDGTTPKSGFSLGDPTLWAQFAGDTMALFANMRQKAPKLKRYSDASYRAMQEQLTPRYNFLDNMVGKQTNQAYQALRGSVNNPGLLTAGLNQVAGTGMNSLNQAAVQERQRIDTTRNAQLQGYQQVSAANTGIDNENMVNQTALDNAKKGALAAYGQSLAGNYAASRQKQNEMELYERVYGTMNPYATDISGLTEGFFPRIGKRKAKIGG
ncbi:MAG TPA: hypothetical protein PKD00_00455 [Burkholderiales bacterium]|nr:hypothetical protein [Burkholderiales bacterium]